MANRRSENKAMLDRRFWVVGGEYADLSFTHLVRGSQQLSGPFRTADDAHDAWRALAFASTAAACTRFSIVEEIPSPCGH